MNDEAQVPAEAEAAEEAFDPKPVLRRLPNQPGVYRMLGKDAEILYVGKARNLKKRVTSYFRSGVPGGKTGALVRQVQGIEVNVTRSETEALILESNLIKEHRPRFNVVLRDDKSYPFIHLSADHEFPRLSFYRGKRRTKGRLFGPYPSAGAVRETLNLIQKLFRLRSCEDSFFAHRSRPCLQYQIRRCTAPCVGLVDKARYAEDVELALRFVEGRSDQLIDELGQRMESAAERLAFEEAARIRDQIGRLRKVQSQAGVGTDRGDIDALGLHRQGNRYCVAVLFIRGGRNLGVRTYFPRTAAGTESAEVAEAFVAQHYFEGTVPNEILVPEALPHGDLLEQALEGRAERRVRLTDKVRGERAQWLKLAASNARQALEMDVASKAGLAEQFRMLRDALDLDETPARLECFDISHTGGESTVASCVVFGAEGALKSDYRRFNIQGIEPGDDYGAMRQALTRRYTRLKRGEALLPDLLLVDGGKGQLAQAREVLDELQIEGVEIVGVAKGRSRKPGMEQLFLAGQNRPLILPPTSGALHLIQQIRDEAHRFAITGHRQRRGKARQQSVLEDIPGLGPKRRRVLLKEFGGLKGVTAAGVDDLARINGISRTLAERIYERLHPAD